MTLKEIDQQIRELKNQRYELEKKEIEEFKKEAVKNVGRCFIVGRQYAKVIGIPKEKYDKVGNCYFNQYQYPALYIGVNTKPFEIDLDNVVPFYTDTLFSGAWGVGNNILDTKYKEITPKEFEAEFDRVLHKFRRKICGDLND